MMRFTEVRIRYRLEDRGSSVALVRDIEEGAARRSETLIEVNGWRADLARRFLPTEAREGIEAMRLMLGFHVLNIARDAEEGRRFLQTVRGLERCEVHFWVFHFIYETERASSAWRAFFA